MNANTTFSVLTNEAGYQLLHSLETDSLAGDNSMWLLRDDGVASPDASQNLSVKDIGSTDIGDRQVQLTDREGRRLDGIFTVQTGPERLPSEHLADVQQAGFTVLDNILSPARIERFKQQMCGVREEQYSEEAPLDGQFWITDGLAWSVDLVHAITHPVAMWIMQQYMNTEYIHFCHQPVITTVKPASELLNTRPEGGWHSDYPYHTGVFPDEHWPDDQSFGVQFNICIDPFTPETAATQFVPGSHSLGHRPSEEFNTGGTRMGEGLHKDVAQMQAPAGAALIYDSRTGHRGCHELNVSGRDRVALLNAVSPAWVLPMLDKTPIEKAYRASTIPELLNEREATDVKRLCNDRAQATPDDMPKLRPRNKGPIATDT